MHVDKNRLQLLHHGELPPAEEAASRAHLSGCEACSQRLEVEEREEERVGALLGELDHPAPRRDFNEIERRAGVRSLRIARWAAVVALVLGLGGAAYAFPGSPLPRWIGAIVEQVGGRMDPEPRPSPGEPPEGADAGIAVTLGQDFLIVFHAPSAGGQVSVTLTDGVKLAIRAPRDAATFTLGEGRLLVEDRGFGVTYEVEVPRTAPRVEIRAGDRLLFRKEGPSVTTAGLQQGSGSYLLRLSTPAP